MRTEQITPTLAVSWRDERRGMGMLESENDLAAVLQHYGMDGTSSGPPAQSENDVYTVTTRPETPSVPYPARLNVERKPQGAVQEAAWVYAEEARMAQIVEQEGEMGVLFLDENQFVFFSRLEHDPHKGFSIRP